MVLIISSRVETPPKFSPTASIPILSPLQLSTPGKTNFDDLKNQNLITSERRPNNQILYTLKSTVARPRELITEGGVVIYEKIPLPLHENDANYTTLEKYFAQYGQPESKQTTSFLGIESSIYVYAKNGFALIGDDKQVFEIVIFQPLSLEDFIQKWGKDLIKTPVQTRDSG